MVVRHEGPGVAKLAAFLTDINGLEGKVGWFESARYPDGTPVAYVAAIHEFGVPGKLQARPFMRPAVIDHGPEWMKTFEDGAKAALRGGTSAAAVLELVTLQAAGDVAQAITQVTGPALSPVTIKAKKGATKPLVDTGQMFQSVTGAVERT